MQIARIQKRCTQHYFVSNTIKKWNERSVTCNPSNPVSEIDSSISEFGHIHCCQKGDSCKSIIKWQSVDPDETAHLSRLNWIYAVCKSVLVYLSGKVKHNSVGVIRPFDRFRYVLSSNGSMIWVFAVYKPLLTDQFINNGNLLPAVTQNSWLQYNFNDSNTIGLLPVADSNSFFESLVLSSDSSRKKYLGA